MFNFINNNLQQAMSNFIKIYLPLSPLRLMRNLWHYFHITSNPL